MTNERLERVLFALKERIPTKLTKESDGMRKRSSAKEKTIVDVYRGSDYQIAFFFRRTGQKHVVLLKDKRLAHPLPDSPPPAPIPQAASKKRAREGAEMLDLTEDAEEGSRAAKRPAEVELIAVKDEEVEPFIPDWGPEQPEEEDYKPDLDDVKPELRVDYKGYTIFNKSLVVIVEPYPALAPSELAKGAPLVPAEVRQLSEMPTDTPRLSRGPSTSATPVPVRRDGQALFRSDTTPLEEVTPALDDDMRQLRESTELLANDLDDGAEDDELPSLNQLISKGRN